MSYAWNYLTELLMVEFSAAPKQLLELYARHAVVEFCERSLWWRKTLTGIDTIVSQDSYSLTTVLAADAPNTTVAYPIYVEYNGIKIDPVTEEQKDAADTTWRSNGDGTPQAYLFEYPNSILLDRPADTLIVGGLVVRVALKPVFTQGTTVENFPVEEVRETIMNGIRYQLYQMPGKPWSDKPETRRYRRLFKNGCSDARTKADKGFTRSSLTVKPRRFAG